MKKVIDMVETLPKKAREEILKSTSKSLSEITRLEKFFFERPILNCHSSYFFPSQ